MGTNHFGTMVNNHNVGIDLFNAPLMRATEIRISAIEVQSTLGTPRSDAILVPDGTVPLHRNRATNTLAIHLTDLLSSSLQN